MTHVHCHVTFHSRRVTFRWSLGKQFFEPYHLADSQWDRFAAAVDNATQHLTTAVDRDATDLLDLANAGHELFQAIFPDQLDAASAIADWLGGLQGDVKLEIVTNRPGHVPWTVVYDRPPPQQWTIDAEAQQGFWANRFALTAGASVHSLRKIPTLRAPDVLLVIDPTAQDKLTASEKDRLRDFLESREFPFADSLDSLRTEIGDASPEIIYFWGRADGAGFSLGSDYIPWNELQSALSPSDQTVEPVLLVNWFSEQPDRPLEGLLDAVSPAPHLLAGCEVNTTPSRSFTFGLDLLERWFSEDETISASITHLRLNEPIIGLAYGVYAPPNARASWEDGDDDETEYELPEQPYRPLMPYEHTDRPLFVERDADVMKFCKLLDDHRTTAVVLHGDLGVGKKSLIRAGAYPLLEDDCRGYRFLFSRDDDDGDEIETSLLAIRATSDLASQIAHALAEFCETPYEFTTPTERTATVDLPSLLKRCLDETQTAIQEKAPTVTDADSKDDGDDQDRAFAIWKKLRSDAGFLRKVLCKLDEALPFQLLILVENTEEVFHSSSAASRAHHDLQLLANASSQDGGAKLIVSIRSDYVVRLMEELPIAVSSQWRSIHLSEPRRMNLLRTILIPTSKDAVLHGHEIPFEKYGFQFEEDAPESLLALAHEAAKDQYVSLLPILQIACTFLYFAVKDRDDKVIRQRDLDALGDMRRLVEQYVDSAIKQIGFERSERWMVPMLIQDLTVRDDKGGVSRRFADYDRMAEDNWKGIEAFPIVVEKLSEPEIGLLDKDSQYHDGGERETLSLGQDVLAQLGAQYQEDAKQKKFARSRLWEAMWIIVPTVFLLIVITYVATRRWFVQAAPPEQQQGITKEQFKEIQAIFQNQVQLIKDRYRSTVYRGSVSEAYRAWQTGSMMRMRNLLLGQRPEPDKSDLRSFEWWYLWRLASGDRHTLEGHKGEITAVAVAPNDKWTASASEDGAVKLWNLHDGKILADFPGIDGPISDVAFSKNSEWLAASSIDKKIHLWKLDNIDDNYRKLAKPLKSLEGHKKPVLDLAFLTDDTLVAADFDGALVLWDINKEKPTKTLAQQKEPFTTLAVSASGKLIVTGDRKGNVAVHPLDDAKPRSFTFPGIATSVSITPNEATLAVGGIETKSGSSIGGVHLIDLKTAKQTRETLRFTSGVSSLAFNGDNELLVAGRDDAVLRWNIATGRKETVAKGHFGRVRTLAVAHKNGWFVTGSADRNVKIWDLGDSEPTVITHQRNQPVKTVAFFPDSKMLASTGGDQAVKIWNIDDGRLLTAIDKLPGDLRSMAVSPAKDAYRVAVAYADKNKKDTIDIWQLEKDKKQKWSPKKLLSQEGHAGRTTRMTWSPDGASLVSTGTDNLVVLWDLATKKRRLIGKAHQAAIVGLSFSKDGKQLATVDIVGRLILWKPATGEREPLAKFIDRKTLAPVPFFETGHTAGLHSLVFLAGGEATATAGRDRTIRVQRWLAVETKSNATMISLISSEPMRGHTDVINSLAAHPTKNIVVSGSADGTVRLWDAGQLVQRFAFTDRQTPIQAVAISPDRLTIAAGNADGEIRLWRSAPRIMSVEHK